MHTQVLLENAYEAWAAAIRYCDDILSGKCTLHYQKSFVSAVHNAVELFMKQMMLNDNDKTVAEIRDKKNKELKELQSRYSQSSDLNNFFSCISDEERKKFRSINFSKLVYRYKDILKTPKTDELTDAFDILKNLRNDETHFIVQEWEFLSESDFVKLHNFMIDFYKILTEWEANDGSISLLPFWGSPIEDDTAYFFEREPLKDFSYKDAVKNAPVVKEIAKILESGEINGDLIFSSYSIAKEILTIQKYIEYNFDDLWTFVRLMKHYGMI